MFKVGQMVMVLPTPLTLSCVPEVVGKVMTIRSGLHQHPYFTDRLGWNMEQCNPYDGDPWFFIPSELMPIDEGLRQESTEDQLSNVH